MWDTLPSTANFGNYDIPGGQSRVHTVNRVQNVNYMGKWASKVDL